MFCNDLFSHRERKVNNCFFVAGNELIFRKKKDEFIFDRSRLIREATADANVKPVKIEKLHGSKLEFLEKTTYY